MQQHTASAILLFSKRRHACSHHHYRHFRAPLGWGMGRTSRNVEEARMRNAAYLLNCLTQALCPPFWCPCVRVLPAAADDDDDDVVQPPHHNQHQQATKPDSSPEKNLAPRALPGTCQGLVFFCASAKRAGKHNTFILYSSPALHIGSSATQRCFLCSSVHGDRIDMYRFIDRCPRALRTSRG